MPMISKPFRLSLTIAGIMLAAIIVADLLRPVPPEARLRNMRDVLMGLRAAADSCRAALDHERGVLQASDARFDSLKGLIERYEALDPRGVPADSYEVYIEAFNTYNEGIPAREAAGDTLKAHWDVCRAIVARHNQLADSARALAEELDLVNDSVRRVPVR